MKPAIDEPRAETDQHSVTFLFTDIESSTQLWEQQPEAMRRDLARHDALLRAVIERHHGQVFKTVGDAFYAAFAVAEEAVRAAIEAQSALRQQVGHVRVRMALATGEVEAREGDYFGPALNRVSRLLAAGHGGQILLTRSTADRLSLPLPDGAELRLLGVHRLRDLGGKEAIFQLLPPGLPSKFPPLNTLDIAYRRGLLRATAIATAVVAMMAGLALVAVTQAHHANQQRIAANQQRRIADAQRLEARRNLYVAQMKLAQQSWAEGNVARAQELLDAWRPAPAQEDLRGFEWRYLWRLCQSDALFTLRGHKDGVEAVAFSPDGRTLATGSDDRTVKLWDVPTRQEVATLRGHNGGVGCLVFSPDGKLLATGSSDGTVKLWRGGPQWRGRSLSASQQEPAVLKGHKGSVNAVSFSPDGKLLATGSDDSTIKLWDIGMKRQVASLKGHTAQVNGLVFLPRIGILASTSGDGTVRLWDVATQRKVGILKGYVSVVGGVASSPDGGILATGGFEGVKLWDVATRRDMGTLRGHTGPVNSVAFSPGGKILASAGEDGTLKLWDVKTRQELATFRGHRNGIYSVAFSPDGQHLASGAADNTVKLWSTSTSGNRFVLKGHKRATEAVAFSPNGKLVASSSMDRTVKVWDVATGRVVVTFGGHSDRVFDVAFSPDGKLLASASRPMMVPSRAGEVKLWDVARQRVVATLKGTKGTGYSVAFSPDGKSLAAGNGDNTVTVWNVASRRAVTTLVGFDSGIAWHNALAFSPDGHVLAMASPGNKVKLWEVGRWSALGTLEGHKEPVHSLVFSPDSKRLASVSLDMTAKLWDVATQKEMATLKGHTGEVWGVSFSPDGKTLATSGVDGTVRLWSVAMKQEVATLRGHTAPVEAVAFSPDGKTLASVGDTTVRLWRAASFQEADQPALAPVPGVTSTGGDRTVTVQWQPLPQAVAYQLYRGRPPGARSSLLPRARLLKLTSRPITGTSFTDHSAGLVNGRPQTYGVAALFKGAAGQSVEGPLVTRQACPVSGGEPQRLPGQQHERGDPLRPRATVGRATSRPASRCHLRRRSRRRSMWVWRSRRTIQARSARRGAAGWRSGSGNRSKERWRGHALLVQRTAMVNTTAVIRIGIPCGGTLFGTLYGGPTGLAQAPASPPAPSRPAPCLALLAGAPHQPPRRPLEESTTYFPLGSETGLECRHDRTRRRAPGTPKSGFRGWRGDRSQRAGVPGPKPPIGGSGK